MTEHTTPGSGEEATTPGDPAGGPPRPTLTEADVRLIAEAIRRGTASAPPGGADVLGDLVKLVVVIALLFGVYDGLHRWHPAVAATYSGDAADSLRSLVVTGPARSVSWAVPGVYASSLTLAGPADEDATIGLPVLAAACPAIAAGIGGRCTDGTLAVGETIELRWNTAQLVYLAGSAGAGSQRSDRVSLAVAPAGGAAGTSSPAPGRGAAPSPAADPGPPAVQVSVTGATPLAWCYGAPGPGAALKLQVGERTATVPAAELTPSGCAGGLVVAVAGRAGVALRRPPTATFGAVTSLTIQATSGAVEVRDLGGLLHLGGAGTDTLSPAAVVHLAAHGSGAVHSSLALDGSGEQLELTAAHLSDASSDGIQLVNSWWDRENSISVPLFLAACATPLALLPAFLDKLWRWRKAGRAGRAEPGAQP